MLVSEKNKHDCSADGVLAFRADPGESLGREDLGQSGTTLPTGSCLMQILRDVYVPSSVLGLFLLLSLRMREGMRI